MDNEINLFDMLLAKKLGGSSSHLTQVIFGENGTYTPDTFYDPPRYDGWDEVKVNTSLIEEEITAASPSQITIPSSLKTFGHAHYSKYQHIEFTFNSQSTGFPITIVPTAASGYAIYGGACDSTGTGAVFFATGTYDTPGTTIIKSLMIQNNSVTDITQYAQVGMSDIKITLQRIINSTDV